MLALTGNARIFVFRGAVNMRNGFEGLSALAEEALSEPITSGAYFVFINRRRDRMKALYWDGDGLALWYKRLEKGTFAKTHQLEMSRRDFFMLLEGVVPRRMQRRFQLEKKIDLLLD